MGKFIVSRSAAGDRFRLFSDVGHTLAVSRQYATLDACKKGIASLITNAPHVPLVDSTAGEYGPNPKFEIVAAKKGFSFVLKSANGKSIVTSRSYATKKACLRAIAMLRTGVLSWEILFEGREGLVPLTMTLAQGPEREAPKSPHKTKKAKTAVAAPTCKEQVEEEIDTEPIDTAPFAPAPLEAKPTDVKPHTAPDASAAPTVQAALPSRGVTPRLIRLHPEKPQERPVAAPPPAPTPRREELSPPRRSLLQRIFKK